MRLALLMLLMVCWHATAAAAAPSFVQRATGQQLVVGTAGLAVTPAANVTQGNRLIVQAETWSAAGATIAAVTDAAGNTYTRLLSRKAPDGTELSVWTAPITAGGGTRPAITVKPTGSASLGFAVLEYSGLSTDPGTAVLDQSAVATGTTGSAAATVASGTTPALTSDNDLVLGLYADSGFGVTQTADAAYTQRVNTSPSAISDLVAEDRLLGTGATPGATVRTGPYTDWLMATLALRPAGAVAPPPPPPPAGQWSTPISWPLVAVHAVLLKTGNMLVWDGWSSPQPTSLLNLGTQGFSTFLPHGSIFCSGQAQMPDGRILVAGGHGQSTTGKLGLANTEIYDPATSTWTRVADMRVPRWYPGLTELPDGRYVAISGNSDNATTWADTPEIYDPSTDRWTLMSGVSTPQVHEEEYPFTYLLPSGKVFTIGPSEDVSYLLDTSASTWTPTGGTSTVKNGSSVMYRPGKILYSGGAASLDTVGPASATTAVIDTTAATPRWRTTAPMANARVYHSLTMLADGRVLAVGGQPASGEDSDINTGVLPTEIWDPNTETWSASAPISLARGYHSTSTLLPDGRVLVAGGGHAVSNTGPGQFSAEIYYPSYLFAGTRPSITSLPASGTYGSTVSLATPDAASIRSVNLVSLGATTHQSDMSQHFVPLGYTATAGGLNVQLPASASLAPPATYMVFIVDDKGVPSVASMITLGATAPPPPPPPPPGAPAFVQQKSAQQLVVGTGGLGVTPAANVSTGNRIVVTAETWGASGATVGSVTDSAGNTYTRLLTRKASEGTELSVWTAPITAGGGTKPTVTVKPTSTGSLGVSVLEYSGLTTAAGTAVLDKSASATGTTGAAASVASGPTAALTAANELVLGVYADSGFGVSQSADTAYAQRVNTSPSDISDMLVEDRVLGAGATPNATVRTGASTVWLMATLALKP